MEIFEQVQKHERTIYEDVLPRLDSLERSHLAMSKDLSELRSDMAQVQRGQAELQLTFIRESNKTSAAQDKIYSLLDRFTTHYFEQDNQKAESTAQLAQLKLTTREKVIVGIFTALFGGSGLAGLIVSISQLLSK